MPGLVCRPQSWGGETAGGRPIENALAGEAFQLPAKNFNGAPQPIRNEARGSDCALGPPGAIGNSLQ